MEDEMNLNTIRKAMPYIIPEADFDRKLNMSERNVTHTEDYIAKGVNDFTLPGLLRHMVIALLSRSEMTITG